VTYAPPRSAAPQQTYHGPEASRAAAEAPDWSAWSPDYGASALQARAQQAAQGALVPARRGGGGARQPARPPAFGLTPAGQLAISPWWALGIVAGLVGLGVFVEYRYKLAQRTKARVAAEVEDTREKAKVTRAALRDEARRGKAKISASRRRLADRLHRAVAGDEAEA
jgi:hypothetical protein